MSVLALVGRVVAPARQLVVLVALVGVRGHVDVEALVGGVVVTVASSRPRSPGRRRPGLAAVVAGVVGRGAAIGDDVGALGQGRHLDLLRLVRVGHGRRRDLLGRVVDVAGGLVAHGGGPFVRELIRCSPCTH